MTLHRRGPIYDIGQLAIDKSYYRKQAVGLYLDNLVIAVLCFALPMHASKAACIGHPATLFSNKIPRGVEYGECGSIQL
jgi:hypothetical protein